MREKRVRIKKKRQWHHQGKGVINQRRLPGSEGLLTALHSPQERLLQERGPPAAGMITGSCRSLQIRLGNRTGAKATSIPWALYVRAGER